MLQKHNDIDYRMNQMHIQEKYIKLKEDRNDL